METEINQTISDASCAVEWAIRESFFTSSAATFGGRNGLYLAPRNIYNSSANHNQTLKQLLRQSCPCVFLFAASGTLRWLLVV